MTTLPDVSAWSDRLTIDRNVSATSPVVKGTWVTVKHVVSLIVQGWTWKDILRTHPELVEADVRACLAYTVAQGGISAPRAEIPGGKTRREQ